MLTNCLSRCGLVSMFMACAVSSVAADSDAALRADQPAAKQLDISDWKLAWQDEFDYPDAELDARWQSQNGPSGHILSSRWRENAVVKDGVLHLVNKKENRGGQSWTSASVWTKRKFKYGYFECRYRYAEAPGTNNSFWLMTKGPDPSEGKRFEIDINEGHYPNEINTNIHNWTDVTVRDDGRRRHPSAHQGFTFGMRPDYSLELEIPVETRRLRLLSTSTPHFHIREFRVFGVANRYPNPLSSAADDSTRFPRNRARDPDVLVSASGVYNNRTQPGHAADGLMRTSWISPTDGEKFLELEWPEPITVGCVQTVNGWRRDGEWTPHGQLRNFKVQVHNGQRWADIASMDAKDNADFGAEYHTYGLLWTEDELVFYQDRRELRRVDNDFCHSAAPIFLSEAIINWAGDITDDLDGTSMKVDWVRYYQP